jgi:hypothetical protein
MSEVAKENRLFAFYSKIPNACRVFKSSVQRMCLKIHISLSITYLMEVAYFKIVYLSRR